MHAYGVPEADFLTPKKGITPKSPMQAYSSDTLVTFGNFHDIPFHDISWNVQTYTSSFVDTCLYNRERRRREFDLQLSECPSKYTCATLPTN